MNEVCELHGPLMNRLEAKIDEIIQGREVLTAQVASIQRTIDNGLRADIKKSLDAITDVGNTCRGYNERIAVLEGFSWFREWVTDMRTNMFKNVFKLITLAILGLILFHSSDTVVKNLVAGWIK